MKIHILSGDFQGVFEYEGLLECEMCRKPFKRIDEHTYEPDCKCVRKRFRISMDDDFEDRLERECLKQIKVKDFTYRIITKELIDKIQDYENPFVAERFFGHEKCYEEIEKLRMFVLELLGKVETIV